MFSKLYVDFSKNFHSLAELGLCNGVSNVVIFLLHLVQFGTYDCTLVFGLVVPMI